MQVFRCITKLTPCRIEGLVVHGFKRGSTLLDCPTANICTDGIQDAIKDLKKGVYFGWANLRGNVYKMVANIGRNPSFGNEYVSVEVHLLHKFDEDFYDEKLKVLILGSIRIESKFSSLEELKAAIHEDCGIAEKILNEPDFLQCFLYTQDEEFQERIRYIIILMNCLELLRSNIEDASKRIKLLTEDEMTALHEAAQQTDSLLLSRYAKLLVYRGDSIRLISLCKSNSVEVSRLCHRYLKTPSIRKDLLNKLSSEEAFVDVYNSSCEMVRRALIECLIWNKNRCEGCLADRLYSNASLELSWEMRELLTYALSNEAAVSLLSHSKKYYELHKEEMASLAFQKFYQVYTDFKNGAYKDDYDKMLILCRRYLKQIGKPFVKKDIDGKTIYLHDMVLEMWDASTSSNKLFRLAESQYFIPEKYFDVKAKTVPCSRRVLYLFTLEEFTQYYFHYTPYYVIKKLNFMQHFYNATCSIALLNCCVQLLQCCRQFHDESVTNDLIRNIVRCFGEKAVVPESCNTLKKVLTKGELKSLLDMLYDNVVRRIKEAKSNADVFSECSLALAFLRDNMPLNDHKFVQLIEMFAPFEKQISGSLYLEYLSYLQGEVPFDFVYNMGTKEMKSMFSMVRKFESVICVKGNTYLNKPNLQERLSALNGVFNMAIQSHDVRCVWRCLRMILQTEIKFSDISFSFAPYKELFSPDSLGISPFYVGCSGSEEMAKRCRDEVIKAILDWANTKKADNMVSALMYVISFLYFFASEYPEYEDIYTDLMKPLVRFLVDKNLAWTRNKLTCTDLGEERRNKIIAKRTIELLPLSDECKERKTYFMLEKYMRGELHHLPKGRVYGFDGVLYPKVELLNDDTDVTPMAVKPLRMILNMLNDPACSRVFVAILFDKLVSTTMVRDTRDVDEVSEVFSDKEQDITLCRIDTTTLYSKDYAVLDELLNDTSVTWSCQLPGLSVLSSLIVVTNELTEVNALISRKEKRQKFETRQQCVKQKSKPTLASILNKRVHYTRYMRKSVNLVDEMVKPEIDKKKTNLSQLESVINGITFTEQGLKLIYDYSRFFSLTTILRNNDTQGLRKSLSLLQESTLRDIASLSMLQLQIIFQGVILTISMNRSSNVIRSNSLVLQVQQFHELLISTLVGQILINNELVYRGLTPLQKMYTIKTTSNFLYNYLQSVSQKLEQTINDMRKDDITEGESPEVKEVSLDFSDNEVIGRFVETLVYSRTIKEYFGKSLRGIVPLVLMMEVPMCLKICKRLLLTTTFVTQAESIIQRCLKDADSNSDVTNQIMDLLSNATKGMTVAVILLLIRISSNPLFASKDSTHAVVMKVISNVIESGFSSIDVYLFVIEWIVGKIMMVPESEVDSYGEMLMKLKKIDLSSDTGREVYKIVSTILFYSVADASSDEFAIDSIFPGDSYIDKAKLIMSNDSFSAERKAKLVTILENLIVSLDVKDLEDVITQCKLLLSIKSTAVSDGFIELCMNAIKQRRDCNVSVIFMYLFTIQPEKAVEFFTSEYEAEKPLILAKYEEQKQDVKHYLSTPRNRYELEGKRVELPSSLTDLLMKEISEVSSSVVPINVAIRFMAALPALGSFFPAYIAYCKALSRVIPNDLKQMPDSVINVSAFMDELDKEIAPWMLRVLRYMNRCSSKLCDFSDEVREKIMEEFRKRKSLVSAVVALNCFDDNIKYFEKLMEIRTWIQDEQVTELFDELM